MVHPLIGRYPIEAQTSPRAEYIEALQSWTEQIRGVEQNMAAEWNNKRARRSASQLLPILKLGRRENGVFSCQTPEYLPATVAEF
ncbi:hypothetical protein TWF506_002903 [Arthrobotrys conoides]|uniref:Uncharacterized protein n=1 Tax=Arthrobotrys conoides TaxID=74498 RepID=A0AAN8N4P8_9PEZI